MRQSLLAHGDDARWCLSVLKSSAHSQDMLEGQAAAQGTEESADQMDSNLLASASKATKRALRDGLSAAECSAQRQDMWAGLVQHGGKRQSKAQDLGGPTCCRRCTLSTTWRPPGLAPAC